MRRREAAPELVPYAPEDRRMDVKHGKRDGRKQIPTYTDLVDLADGSARVTTPYQEQLINAGLVRINEEYDRFLQRTEAARHRLARLQGQLPADEEAVRRARDEVTTAGAAITATELLPRNHQELAITDEAVLRSRRELMRERRIAAAQAAHESRIAAVDGCRREIKEVCGRIDHEFATAQAAGRRLGDYFVQRIASYWDSLAQAHPEGRHLASRVPAIIFSPPRWVDATCEDGVITLPPSDDLSTEDTTTAPEAMPV
jgi:hypothetical protein